MLWYVPTMRVRSMFVNSLIAATPSQTAFQLGVVENITIAVDPPLTSNEQLLTLLSDKGNQTLTKRDIVSLLATSTNSFYCSFEGVDPVLAQPSTDYTSLQCSLPKIAIESQVAFTVDFSSTPLTTPQTFSFVGTYKRLN